MSAKNYRKELIGLFGNPVDENPTVVIMEAAFSALGLNCAYQNLRIDPEDLEDAVNGLRAFHMLGTHVTVPYKLAIIPYLDELTETAQLIGAVNTVYVRNGRLIGENTDGKGFLASMQEGKIVLPGKHVVILGAGGAARAIAVELALAGVSSITIVNRSVSSGEALCALLREKTEVQADFTAWSGTYVVPQRCDILINATSIGLYPDTACPDIDYGSLSPDLMVCDVIPNPLRTALIDRAQAQGCRVFDGFSMLVNQGAVSFSLWTGKEAPTAVMKEALRREYEKEPSSDYEDLI